MLIEKNCIICNKKLYVPNHKIKTGRGKFCSRSCQNKFYKFKTGKHKSVKGYILIYKPEHPSSGKRGYVFEHRLIIEKKLKRFLKSNEIVHHINGNKVDNRIENLELHTRSSHVYLHTKGIKRSKNTRKKISKAKKIYWKNILERK